MDGKDYNTSEECRCSCHKPAGRGGFQGFPPGRGCGCCAVLPEASGDMKCTRADSPCLRPERCKAMLRCLYREPRRRLSDKVVDLFGAEDRPGPRTDRRLLGIRRKD